MFGMIMIVLFVFVVAGCTVRTYKMTKDRVDQAMVGNQGYLSGSAPAVEEGQSPKTRETVVLEVELGAPWSKAKRVTTAEVKDIPENEYVSEPAASQEEDILTEETALQEVTFTSYEIQKDDTLQKISKKFYGTYKKWKKIYDANLDVIKDPNRIKPGITIKVPQE